MAAAEGANAQARLGVDDAEAVDPGAQLRFLSKITKDMHSRTEVPAVAIVSSCSLKSLRALNAPDVRRDPCAENPQPKGLILRQLCYGRARVYPDGDPLIARAATPSAPAWAGTPNLRRLGESGEMLLITAHRDGSATRAPLTRG